jgi:hypothetical protein
MENIEIIRGTGSFRVKKGAILLYRIGPANGQVQTHNRESRDMRTGEKKEWTEDEGYETYIRRAPTRKGYWTFPYPLHEVFFYAHVWERHMPKKFKRGVTDTESMSQEELEAYLAEYHEKYRAVRRLIKPKLIWHNGPFYSHIKPKDFVGEQNWYLYTSGREWVDSARSHLKTWYRDVDNKVYPMTYSKDHLEIFVPD